MIKAQREISNFSLQRIARQLLEQIVKCGYQAPSGHNMQSWRFTVLYDHNSVQNFLHTVAGRSHNRLDIGEPAAVILVSNDRRNPDGIQDSACAAENISLAAYSLGVGIQWMYDVATICNKPEMASLMRQYGILETHLICVALAVGYPVNQSTTLVKKENVVRWIE